MNFNLMMKQAQGMQKKMQELKEQLANVDYTGKAGGDMVKVVMNGDSVVRSVNIDASIIKAEEKELIEDLLVAAFNDAKSKIEQDSQSQISSMLGGMGLPPGFKMPF